MNVELPENRIPMVKKGRASLHPFFYKNLAFSTDNI